MAISINHKFLCALPDDPDDTLIQVSDWNDTHDISGFGTAAEADTSDFAAAVHGHDWGDISGAPSFLTAETDPVFAASAAASISSTNISNWNSAYSWGDHSAVGYVEYISGALIAGDTVYGTWPTFTPKLILKNDQPAAAGRAAAVIQSTDTTSAAALMLLNSNNTKRLYLQITNSSYFFPNLASIVTEGNTPFYFNTDGDKASGGTSNIIFRLGSYNASSDAFTFDYRKRLGIGTTSPSYELSFSGNAGQVIWMERHTTANTAGNNLTVQAGGATSGATNKNAGDLILAGGVATGTGESGVKIQTAVAGASGTANRLSTNVAFQALGNKWAFGGLTPITTPVITGSRSADLESIVTQLLTALNNRGIITDSTTA